MIISSSNLEKIGLLGFLYHAHIVSGAAVGLLNRNTINQDLKIYSSLSNYTASDPSSLQFVHVDLDWEPATGMAAGTFDEVDGWTLTIDFFARVRLAYPEMEEVMPARSLRQGGLEIYASGEPGGRLVGVKFVEMAFHLILQRLGSTQQYNFGKFYIRYNGNRRGFIEFREPQDGIASSADNSSFSSERTPNPSNVEYRDQIGSQHFATTSFFYIPFIPLLFNAAINELDLDAPRGFVLRPSNVQAGFIFQKLGSQDFKWRDVLPLAVHLSRVPLGFNPRRFVNVKTTVYDDEQRPVAALRIGDLIAGSQ